MKKPIIFWLIIITYLSYAQNPSYQDKLYYTCKIWGYVKYFHYEVSRGYVNWDSVLFATFPKIKRSESNEDFNNILLEMVEAAGVMKIASVDPPEELPPELRFNINSKWFEDAAISNELKSKLDFIRINFRSHFNYWVKANDGSGLGFLAFPFDHPMKNENLSENFPNEFTRLSLLFRSWNIINYFNPYNDIIDSPWDSTLKNSILKFAEANDFSGFVKEIKKMLSKLDDAHVELNSKYSVIHSQSSPKLIVMYLDNNYVVAKSDINEIAVGDIILSIDGATISNIEDSLRPLISAGNSDVLRRFISRYMLRGDSTSLIQITYKDRFETEKSISIIRNTDIFDNWFADYHPCDSLKNVKWKTYPGNIGYVNMGTIEKTDVMNMYIDFSLTKAIIFDLRNYPNSTISEIMSYLAPSKKPFAKLTIPDITFPGTYYSLLSEAGNDNNPNPFKGKIIILCNQETLSQAEFSCMALKTMPDVVVIGSPTAGADGNVTAFNMSNDIRLGFTSMGIFYPDGRSTQRIGIVPDIEMHPSIKGIREGKDELLERAFEIANSIVSVNELAESSFILSPNPASDYIEIDIGNHTLKGVVEDHLEVGIFNVLGERVLSDTPPGPLLIEGGLRLDISGLPAGVYFVKFGNKVCKFIKS